jgi:hypothetical protein
MPRPDACLRFRASHPIVITSVGPTFAPSQMP